MIDQKTPKHFNQAIIWGQIHEFKRKTSEPNNKYFIELSVKCPFPKYGNVRVFGRIWGEELVEEFMKAFKPGDLVRLQGAFSQYKDKDGNAQTNFSFYRADAWDPANDKHTHKRATFRLLGEVNAYESLAEGGRLFLTVKLENENSKYDREDIFEIFVPEGVSLDFGAEYPASTLVRVKGVISQEEDEFGDVTVPSRPVIVEMNRAGKDEAVPF